jgi:hypothetical protein
MIKIELPRMMHSDTSTSEPEESSERPWIHLTTTYDVEAWIDQYNWDLQRFIKQPNAKGYGVCFRLDHGGEIYMHSTEGAVMLDVTPEAEWIVPVIIAATRVEAPHSQIWTLPDDKLTELVLGLSSLIASSRMVANHRYKISKY